MCLFERGRCWLLGHLRNADEWARAAHIGLSITVLDSPEEWSNVRQEVEPVDVKTRGGGFE